MVQTITELQAQLAQHMAARGQSYDRVPSLAVQTDNPFGGPAMNRPLVSSSSTYEPPLAPLPPAAAAAHHSCSTSSSQSVKVQSPPRAHQPQSERRRQQGRGKGPSTAPRNAATVPASSVSGWLTTGSSDDGDAATENAVGEKSAAQDNGAPQKDGASCERCSQLFYAELDKSMKATSKAYFSWVSRILSRAPFEHSKPWWRKGLNLDAVNCGPGMYSSKGQKINASLGFTAPRDEEGKDYALDLSGVDIDLEHEAKECIHWIELNSTALRKILKKWDKANHSTKGRQTLRRYWTDSQYQMLFSPLILELRAVAGMMEGGLEGPHWNLHDDEHDDDEHAHANVDHSEGTGVLTCSICFDTLYKPVGLQCGHVFCRDCLLQSAGVLKEGATLADLRMEPAQFRDDRIPLTNGLRRHSEGQDSAHSAEGDQEDGATVANPAGKGDDEDGAD